MFIFRNIRRVKQVVHAYCDIQSLFVRYLTCIECQCVAGKSTFTFNLSLIYRTVIVVSLAVLHHLLLCQGPMSPLDRLLHYDVFYFLGCPQQANFILAGFGIQTVYLHYRMYWFDYAKAESGLVAVVLMVKHILLDNRSNRFCSGEKFHLNDKEQIDDQTKIRKYYRWFTMLPQYTDIYVTIMIGKLSYSYQVFF